MQTRVAPTGADAVGEGGGSGGRASAGAGAKGLARAFVQANRRLSLRLTPAHLRQLKAINHYKAAVNELVLTHPVRVIADVGAGTRWLFAHLDKERLGLRVIGIDIDAAEMEGNVSLDERIGGDVCREIAVPDGSVSLMTARSAVEHFDDTEGFLRNAWRALAPGGHLVMLFPGRYAPFAILNRLVSNDAAKRLLHTLRPGSEGILGFKAYYDRTNPSAFTRLAEGCGFTVSQLYCSYYSSEYFAFLFPAYCVSLAFDHLRHVLGFRDLASHVMVVLRKPAAG